MRMRSLAALGAASLFAAVALTGCTAADAASGDATNAATDDALTFAFPPGTDDPDMLAQVDIVAEQLAEVTGREVAVENPADYMAVVEAVRSGFVDVAIMSPFSTALAFQNGSVEPLVVWDAESEPASLCLVLDDSPIETVEDFRGGQIAFVDPGSTTGYFMPKSFLADNDLVDGEDYDSTFAGGHDSAILALVNGSVDMACTATQVLPMLVDGGLIGEDQYRIVGETDPIPVGVAIVVNSELDDEARAAITEELPDILMADESLAVMFGGSTSYQTNPDVAIFEPLMAVAEKAGVTIEDLR
jgi:phosphonate transport system substrate-binding protein